ncbi:MAG: O-methyltransferase [Thermoanaerobaculia bacterium]
MKHGKGAILHAEQESYLERLLPPRDPVLREIEEYAAREDVPISDPEVGRFLGIMARATGARLILEIGAAIGYGAICLARGAPEARVVSFDVDPGRLAMARQYVEKAELAHRVELLEGDVLEGLHRLPGTFDLVYVDADKAQYRRYLDQVVPRLRVGGVILVDNLLWSGHVAVPPEEDDPSADALRAFNGYLMMHPQLQSVVIPLGDGMGVATKFKPTILEMGGPY